MNILEVDGHKATITYSDEMEMFRGEILGLSGYADFYASTVKGLKKELRTSLKVYLESCEEEGLEPYKSYSGKFVVRVPADLHERIATQAAGSNQSLNQWVTGVLKDVAG